MGVLRTLSTEFSTYVERCWLPTKEMWCTSYMTAMTYGCTTNNRVKSAHRWLKDFFEHQ